MLARPRAARWLVALVFLMAAALVGGACGSGASTDTTSTTVAKPATPALSGGAPPKSAQDRKVERAVRTYYARIDSGDYRAAWKSLSPAEHKSLGGSYKTWRSGFGTTTRSAASVGIEDASGKTASVSVSVNSASIDACGRHINQQFQGSWKLEKHGGGWRPTDISMSKIGGPDPITNKAKCPMQ